MNPLVTRGDGRSVSGKVLGSLFLLALLLAQVATAVSYPIAIPFGRSWPVSVVVDPARGFAYIDATSGDYPPTGFLFGVINMTSHEVVKVLPLNEIPGPMALNQGSGDIYIAGNDSIRVFDAGNQSMGRRIGVGHLIVSMVYDGRVSGHIFVSSGNKVYAVDPQSDRVVANATVGNGANGMALDPASGRLFVAEYPDAEIFVFQATDLSPAGVIRLPACCAAQMAVDPKTRMLFATTRTQFVDIVSTQSGAYVRRVQVAPGNQNSTNLVAIDNETGTAFVASAPGGSIVRLDPSGSAVVGKFKVDSQVAGMAVNFRTHELFASNYHQVTVFDVSRGQVLFFSLVFMGAAAGALAAAALVVYVQRTRRSTLR